ncbi:hypothetical protein, partial [Nonomuraea sp. NPDC050691]|uniref:hypothetical protein n=1 Tax=Nonomuraea sp. NPDC050691 TaxID=3155661 RepID=UPI0033ED5D6E
RLATFDADVPQPPGEPVGAAVELGARIVTPMSTSSRAATRSGSAVGVFSPLTEPPADPRDGSAVGVVSPLTDRRRGSC